MAVGARGGRLGADEQVRRGVSRQAVLRRLRGRRRDRAARNRAGQGVVSRRARKRAAARGRAGEHGGVPRADAAGRHDPLAAPRPRRPSHARSQGQLLRPALHDRPLRRLARDEPRRLRRGARARQGAPSEGDPLRRLRVPAHRRDVGVPQDRRRGRSTALVRHGPLRRARRCGAAPESDGRLRRRHLDDAQDTRRAARGLRPLSRGACVCDRPRRLPRAPGRAARAHDRREGDLLQDRRL